MKKKVWLKPKLVVLYRGRPEEVVLNTCKTAVGVTPLGANDKKDGCWFEAPACDVGCLEVVTT